MTAQGPPKLFFLGGAGKILDAQRQAFPVLNRAYNKTFQPERLSIGLVAPLEANRQDPIPSLDRHIDRAKRADMLGFSALWLRDIPFNVPSFGDVGQIHDPFVYLGMLSVVTTDIALGIASVILPLRHPAHIAKAAASVDELSAGRLLLGVASGDRPEEYPLMNMDFDSRGHSVQQSIDYIRAMGTAYPQADLSYGRLSGTADMLPKPVGPRLPLIITGGSQQSPEWVAQNGDGWMTYPRNAAVQGRLVADYRRRAERLGAQNKPVMQSLYIDLQAQNDAPPEPIHLGFSSGIDYLKHYLHEIQALGINHVALNLRFNQADIDQTMDKLANDLLPEFHT